MASCQHEDVWGEGFAIFLEARWRIPLGVYGDEEWKDFFPCGGGNLLKHGRHGGEGDGADIGTMGEAKKDEFIACAFVVEGVACAMMVYKGELSLSDGAMALSHVRPHVFHVSFCV